MYEAIGGHETVRGFVAEDVMIAQTVWKHGGRVSLALGQAQLSTRMYDGLSSLVRGWSKNVFAGGRHAMRGGRIGQLLFPLGLLFFPLFILAPTIALLVTLWLTISRQEITSSLAMWLAWSALSLLGVCLAAGHMNRFNGDSWRRGLLAPLGGTVLLVIVLIAIARGSNVRWKDRGYQSR
jgi:chlorobactene glucosyltransferase